MRNDKYEERRELEAAGWKSEEREDEIVWQHPENGFWYPQGVAIALLREGADADVPMEPEGGTRSARETHPKEGWTGGLMRSHGPHDDEP